MKPNFYYKGQQHGIDIKKRRTKCRFKDDLVTKKTDTVVTLIPQGHAHLATSSAKKVLAENLKQRAHKEAKVISDAEAVADALIEIKIVAKAGGENYSVQSRILISLPF
jgi:large subunit ribosomal protein L9